MWYDFLTNPVLVSVVILLVLAVLRLNIVFSIIIAAFAGGLWSGIGDAKTLAAFSNGLGNGAKIAFNYAMLGAFSIVISRSGLTELLAQTLLKKLNKEVTSNRIMHFKYALLFTFRKRRYFISKAGGTILIAIFDNISEQVIRSNVKAVN